VVVGPEAVDLFVIEVARRSAVEQEAAWKAWGGSDPQTDSNPAGTGGKRPGEENCCQTC
jgi:hypothetical protein